MIKEKRFYNSLKGIFEGAKMDGQGGFVNLLKIKEKYYNSVIEQFKKEVDQDPIINEGFKEEFFDKLCNFFDKYFSESGSIYFVQSANWQKVYEKIYTDNKDVVLFWKTNMLYYVKSDKILNSSDIKIEDKESGLSYVFRFDTTQATQKQNNEKKGFLYIAKEVVKTKTALHDSTSGDSTFVLSVGYESKSKTKIEEIAKTFNLNEEIIKKAIRQFEKQTSVDFFINKNAQQFLNEQLDLYLHQILLADENVFDQSRLTQIKTIKEYAKKLISFIGGFEDELVRIWNKPKFVLNSDYVMSLKTLKQYLSNTEYNELLKTYQQEIALNEDCFADIVYIVRETYKRPLQNLYIDNVKWNKNENQITFKYIKFFKKENVDKASEYAKAQGLNLKESIIQDKGESVEGYIFDYNNQSYKTQLSIEELYLDTKFLKIEDKLELLENLSKNNSLDEIINGYVIKSDNYQFLNSVNKFNNKVSVVYIDPPFNTNTEGFAFIDGFKDSTWLSQMNDRFNLLYNKFMSRDSSLYVHGDHHCNYYMRLLLDNICGSENFNREIIWNTSPAISGRKAGPKVKNYIRQHDTILYYLKGNPVFNKLYREYKNSDEVLEKLGWLDMYCDENKTPYVYKYDDNSNIIKVDCADINVMALGDVWNDLYSMMYSQNMTRENWGKSNTQKPENLIRRILQVSSQQNEYIMDIFVGSGTTIAAAHKLGRKWIGVDSGDFLEDIVIKRMKSVVMGDFMPKLSEDLNWKGGGIFKYYDLEQYEDSLRKSNYNNTNNSYMFEENIYQYYTFFADKKLTSQFNVENNGDIKIELDKLYKNIDLPETISNIMGLPIKTITKDTVVLLDGEKEIVEKYDYQNMTNEEKLHFFEILKPLLWWGE